MPGFARRINDFPAHRKRNTTLMRHLPKLSLKLLVSLMLAGGLPDPAACAAMVLGG